MARVLFLKATPRPGLWEVDAAIRGYTRGATFVRPHRAGRRRRLDGVQGSFFIPAVDHAAARVEPAVEAAVPGLEAALHQILPRLLPGTRVQVRAASPTNAAYGVVVPHADNSATIHLRLTAAPDDPRPRRPESILRTAFHELGHIVAWTRLAEADPATRAAVIAQWQADRKQDARRARGVQWETSFGPGFLRRHEDAARRQAQAQTREANGTIPYANTFHEWLADRVMHWLATDRRPRSVTERFFAAAAEALRHAWTEATRALGFGGESGALERMLVEGWTREPLRSALPDSMRNWWHDRHPELRHPAEKDGRLAHPDTLLPPLPSFAPPRPGAS